jgi:hypothetical protein
VNIVSDFTIPLGMLFVSHGLPKAPF